MNPNKVWRKRKCKTRLHSVSAFKHLCDAANIAKSLPSGDKQINQIKNDIVYNKEMLWWSIFLQGRYFHRILKTNRRVRRVTDEYVN